MPKKISLVTPCYNEEAGIRESYAVVKDIFDRELPGYEREHIFCDNASTDRTVEILKEIAAEDPSVKVIVNSRNFGVLRSTYNGVLASTGDATVLFMPADLQDPPALIPTFVKHWEDGYEIVFGIRARREEAFLSRTARHLYYKAISTMSYVDYPADVGDYQLVDRKVLHAMKQFEDVQPFMRMMPFECGFRSIGVPYTWLARKHGISRNRLSNLIDQGLLGAISFSTVPLRVAFFFGLLISSLSFTYAFVVFLLKIAGFDIGPHGIPTIIIGLFFFGGVQLFFLGVLGEYIVAIFNQVRRRPIVIERERVNF
ncbi:glycosyltransferase family 2 protein [Bradyrhizobium sp. 149]|uniref:glycosyltransferase family 2 protein n=1 Tax=Bradyrhizobium sp. 149 TaxID=2782624 RepID=UPI001FF7D233|nr:glycosyltransferase family 2 protein [Bradyrhizobium sp. 149]MCK1652696.1 glycosyltransferase family 2 protein [Bradyrhizobium sp. 149]